jgi:hypothetical protein
MRWAVVLVVVTACGRIGFDNATQSSDPDARPPTIHSGRPQITILGVKGTLPNTMHDAWITSVAQNRSAITGNTTIDDAALANTEVILLLDPQKTYSAAESEAIANVVKRGGGLLATTGYGPATDLDLFNAALLAFGTQSLDLANNQTPVTDFASHPITAGVTSLPFMGGNKIVTTVPSATTIARFNGVDVATAFDFESGRVAVWGDDWVASDLAWDANTLRYWDNALAWVWPTQ